MMAGLFDDVPMTGEPRGGVTIRPTQRAFLNAMSAGEAPDYNTVYGGGRFEELNDHPRQNVQIQSGPNAGKTSSAAGRYQFLAPTWDEARAALSLPDFSPNSQDAAAAWLAERDYKARTRGRDLWADIEAANGDPARLNFIAGALNKTWTSLPGGAEPNAATRGFGKRMADEISAQRRQPEGAQAVSLFADIPMAQDTVAERFAGDTAAPAAQPELKTALRERQSPRERGRAVALDEGTMGDAIPRAISHGMMGNLPDYVPAVAAGIGGAVSGEGFGAAYDRSLEEQRGQREGLAEKFQVTNVAGNIAGALVPGVAASKFINAPNIAGRVVQGVVTGGALGLAHGAASGEGLEDRIGKAGEGATWGAALGGLGEGAVSAGGALYGRMFGGVRSPAGAANARMNAADEFNIPLSRGQATGDVSQQAWELAAANNARGNVAGNVMRGFTDRQNQAIASARDDIASGLGGVASTADEAGEAVASGIRARAEDIRSASNAAYNRAAQGNVNINAGEVSKLASNVTDDLADGGIILDTYGNYPGAQAAMNLLRRVSGFEGAPQGEGKVVAQSLMGLDQARKGLLKVQAANAEDARALKSIRKSFDKWLDKAIDDGLFSGDPEAIKELKAARGLWSQYLGIVEAGETGSSKIISKIATEERTGAEVANWLLSTTNVGQAGQASRVAHEIAKHLGRGSDAFEGLRQAAWTKIVNPTSGTGNQAVSSAIINFVDGNGSPLAKALFTSKELGQMRRFAGVLKSTLPDARATNRGQSGYEIFRSAAGSGQLMAAGGGIAATWQTGDPKYMAIAALPLLRGASNTSKALSAIRPTSAATGQAIARGARAGYLANPQQSLIRD